VSVWRGDVDGVTVAPVTVAAVGGDVEGATAIDARGGVEGAEPTDECDDEHAERAAIAATTAALIGRLATMNR
jgi:hypothetical protein